MTTPLYTKKERNITEQNRASGVDLSLVMLRTLKRSELIDELALSTEARPPKLGEGAGGSTLGWYGFSRRR